MEKLEKMWEFKLEKQKIDNVALGGNHVVLSSGNELICFNSEGIAWTQKMQVTFYRDPYGDVVITALDANQSYVVAGTNFMDGKIYLFTINGKLRWKHQFATIASLGWRPEDITAVKVGDSFIAVGTEFMNEYIHLYTVNRRRIFQRRIKGRVEDFSFIEDKLVAGTDSNLYIFDMEGKEKSIIETPVRRVEIANDKIIVLNDYGVVVYRKYENSDKIKIKKYWGVRLQDPLLSIVDGNILLASENLLSYVSGSGEVVWQKVLDKPVESLFYDEPSNRIYVGMEDSLQILSNNGESVKEVKFEGELIRIGRFENIVVLVYRDGRIGMYGIW